MYEGLATIFDIKKNEVIACFDKTGAVENDVWELQMAASLGFDALEDQGTNVKKGVCTIVCCAQKQGTMVGDRLQLPIIRKLINDVDMPIEVKVTLNAIITECAEQVKGITGECDVGLRFLTCMVALSDAFGP
ncbi:uncharacterized protein LOC143341687 isoform X2 [Colletes latitarsis]